MTTKTALLLTIRKHCLNCCSGSYSDVEGCTAKPGSKFSECALWAYRLGKDPEEPTEGMKAKGKRIAELRKARVIVQPA